jgi:sugar phosphate isomerase/epimerase
MTREIELHVHSYSLRFHLRYRDTTGYDVFSYIDEMAGLGMTGVNVSANGPGLRDLCGSDDAHFRAVRSVAAERGLRLELDTSDTRTENMEAMLRVASACGADTLRTYTKYRMPLEETIKATISDLRAVASLAADLGVLVVLENHEDFTGPVLARILSEVDHPSVRALYDYGNSQMVGEDPFDALDAMAPFIARVHAKDHVVIDTPAGLVVQGVPFGTGRLDTLGTTDRLYAAGVRRFCFENVWSYAAPVLVPADELPRTPCFERDDPARHLVGDTLDRGRAVAEERAAFDSGLAAFRAMLDAGGYVVRAGSAG